MDSFFYITGIFCFVPIITFFIGATFLFMKRNYIYGIVSVWGIVLFVLYSRLISAPDTFSSRLQSISPCKKKEEIFKDGEVTLYEYADILLFSEDCILYSNR